ncbi:MAG: enoyl-CoA hydratase/isomerase family protein [Myxococcales bacterium]|nr:enoyl-CoA hydratase/isomerase family protein [Myxococcales bacterium]MCB9718625.1 enoyl-CoA hydratase/isomerase family protein [Myxococcales bacterium]
MDLSSIEALHPSLDPARRLLVLDLDHGKANEMGSEQLDALARLCTGLEADASVTCLCTTSHRASKKGTPIFIAGANVTERVGWDDDRVKAHVLRQRALMRRLRRLPLFTVVLSHGVTLGWGTEYLLTADYSLATPTASFGLPETGLGILPGARGTAELASLVGPAHALRLGCTGETVDAHEALRIGLVQEVVDDLDAGLARVHALAERLMQRSPTAVAAFKRALLEGLGQPEAVRLDLERAAYEHTVDTGEAAVGRASFDEIRQGRTPSWGPRR